jgi:hypothetical protein
MWEDILRLEQISTTGKAYGEVDIHYFVLELYNFNYRWGPREEGRHIGSPCLNIYEILHK